MTCDRVYVLPLPVTPSRTWWSRPLARPVDERLDRLRLVPGRLERRDELEVRHAVEVYQSAHEPNRCSVVATRRPCAPRTPAPPRPGARVRRGSPDVSIDTRGDGRTRSTRSPWAAIRWSASSPDEPRPIEPGPLRGGVAGHQPDLVAELGEAALDELDRLDDDGVGAGGLGRGDGGQDPRPDRRDG